MNFQMISSVAVLVAVGMLPQLYLKSRNTPFDFSFAKKVSETEVAATVHSS